LVFKQTEPEKRRLCHELARFLTAGENQRLLASYGQFPTRRSAGEIYEGQPLMQAAQRIVAGGFPLPTHPRWGTVDSRLKSALQSVFLGKAEAAETLNRLAKEARELAAQAQVTASGDAGPAPDGASSGAVGAALAGLLLAAALGLIWARRGRLGDGSAYFFLLPSLSVFAAFTVWPVLRALLLAFQDYSPGAGMFEGFNGLTNFREALGHADFVNGIRNTVIYTAVVVPVQIALGLVLASLLYPLSTAARNFFRAAFYLPGVASVVVMAMVWRWLYDDSFGLANRLLSLAPLEPVRQLVANLTPLIARPGWALAALYVTIFLGLVARGLLGSGRLAAALAAAAGLGGCCWLAFGLDWAWQPAGPIRWLTSTELSLFSIALSTILKGPGGALLIYLAAMEAIPPELFEAAKADGAGPLRQWWYVMLPLVRPTTLFLAVTGVIDSFQVFAQVLMLTDGGPAGSSTVIVHQIYTRAFRDLEFGQASAMALMLFVVLVLISVIQYRFLRSDWEF
jgi:multiple sugar transport system permease protein